MSGIMMSEEEALARFDADLKRIERMLSPGRCLGASKTAIVVDAMRHAFRAGFAAAHEESRGAREVHELHVAALARDLARPFDPARALRAEE